MTSPGNENIVVRVEVQVPGRTPGRGKETTKIIPGSPLPGQKGVKVRVDAASGEKYVCAHGHALQGDTPARFVFARVYVGYPAPFPDWPPNNTRWVTPDSYGFWIFSGGNNIELPGADCDANPPGALNTLVVWADYGTTPLEMLLIPFRGVCGTETECAGIDDDDDDSDAGGAAKA